MDHRLILLLLLFLLPAERAPGQHRVVFYNVENLFDTTNDPGVRDGEFTPTGNRRWTRERYVQKILRVSRALADAGGGRLPLLVGLAEIENRGVLSDLVTRTSLAPGNYGILHVDSPDPRGIDVALLYRKKLFRVLDSAALTVPLERGSPTRDILYCKGLLLPADTLHLLVCHFPSMIGGERQTEWKRLRAAGVLRRAVDSIQRRAPRAAIIIMGDLNGTRDTKAQQHLRVTLPPSRPLHPSALYYTSAPSTRSPQGTYRYRGRWQTLDHIIVSGSLLNGDYPRQVTLPARVFMPPSLLEDDTNHYGKTPFPTFRGSAYLGGYSDHLPVYIIVR
ncbi:MAG: endonuclease/exonuclease/phosphatase family protein [Odoribacteraceae bacterium]|nr:endonuclease/exonuclease/phosphatase family protein [Odoribacteraceae bacterium]